MAVIDADDRFVAKAALDPYFSGTWRAYGSPVTLLEAGFFDDGLIGSILDAPEADPNWMTTPFEKVARHLSEFGCGASNLIVLLTTGGFSPLHREHVAMMETAKAALEGKGYRVIGGFLSPSHDDYVSTKYDGTAACPAASRITWCELATADHPWLDVDPWESRYLDRPVNFTDVIRRLESYLNAHLGSGRSVRVAYVFGGDNAGFARAFVESGICVCVGRPGHEDRLEEMRRDTLISGCKRILLVDGTGKLEDVSSKSIREGRSENLPAPIRDVFESYRRTAAEPMSADESGQIYLIRDEGMLALERWRDQRNAEELSNAWAEFRRSVVSVIGNAFPPERGITPILADVGQQAEQTSRALNGKPSISLDVFVRGTHNLDLSRAFDMSGGQWKSEGLVVRPGTSPLLKQLAMIPSGTYVLVEDDIASGGTVAAVKRLLPDGVSISDLLVLSNLEIGGRRHGPFFDVVDLRDFLVGAKAGGLVVKAPDGFLVRVPYLPPYVNLRSRAKLPPTAETAVGMAIWEANAVFFRSVSRPIRLGECDPALGRALTRLGFSLDMNMETVCRWHLDRLERAGWSDR